MAARARPWCNWRRTRANRFFLLDTFPLPEDSLTYPSSPGSVRIRHILLTLSCTALVAAAGACHPDEPTSVAELDVVATAHEDSVNYGAITT